MFLAIVGFSLRYRAVVLVVAALLLGWGGLVAGALPIELLPETRPPAVTVTAEAGTLAAEEVEQLVTLPIEQAMQGIAGATGVRSTSSAGSSLVQVVFGWGADPYRDRQLVSEKLALARERLPAGVVPLLAPLSAASGTVMVMGVTGGANPMALRDYVDSVLRPRLLTLDGVSEVRVAGGEVRSFRFTPNPVLMEYRGVTLAEVERALAGFGGTAGHDADGAGSLDEMRGLVVSSREGGPVLLGQVGEATVAPAATRGGASFDGKPSVNLDILRHPGANTVEVADRVLATVEEMRQSAPAGVTLGLISYNQADPIRAAVENVSGLLLDGVVLVALVLLVFLARLWPAAISLAAIPISLVVTVIVFRLVGLSVNNMTLGGIAIALGQLVDDSVVNVENILRRLDENRKLARPKPAIQVIAQASREVRSGIVHATLVVMIVFIPLLAMPGQPGRMLAPMMIATIVSILASLVVSITVTPALASYLLPQMPLFGWERDRGLWRRLCRGHECALIRVLDRPRAALTLVLLAVLAAAAAVPSLPRSFLPQFDEGNVDLRLRLDPGLPAAESARIGHMAEQILMQIPEVKALSRRSGGTDPGAGSVPVNDNEMVLRVRLDQGRDRSELEADIRQRLAIFAARADVSQFQLRRLEQQDNMAPGDVVLKLFGPDLRMLRTVAEGFYEQISHVRGLVDVGLDQQNWSPRARITIDAARAKLFGVTPAQIADTLAAFPAGRTLSQRVENGRRFDVVLRLDDEDLSPAVLSRLRLDTPAGPIPVSSVATLTPTFGPGSILREDGERRIAVTANLDGSQDAARVVAQLRDIVARVALPAGCRAELEGDFRRDEQGRGMLLLLGPAAVILVFVVLQQRFRSVRLSLIVMGSIPLALAGSVIAVAAAGLDLNLAVLVGCLAVIGVAVRNSLLKVSHFINLHLHEGMPTGRGLVLRGSNERLLPVLTTACAAGAAVLPLLFAADMAGAEILHPAAVAIVGGLIGSTLLDSFTTPILFEQFGVAALERMIASHVQLAHETF